MTRYAPASRYDYDFLWKSHSKWHLNSLWRTHSTLSVVQILHQKESTFNYFGMQPWPRPALVYGTQNLGNHYSQINFNWLRTWIILMMLLCENEKLLHAYSNDRCSMCSLKKPKQISLFNRQMDTLLKLVKTKCSTLLQLPWQHKKFHVQERFWPTIYIWQHTLLISK